MSDKTDDDPKIMEPHQNQDRPTKSPLKKVLVTSSNVPETDGQAVTGHRNEEIILFGMLVFKLLTVQHF